MQQPTTTHDLTSGAYNLAIDGNHIGYCLVDDDGNGHTFDSDTGEVFPIGPNTDLSYFTVTVKS